MDKRYAKRAMLAKRMMQSGKLVLDFVVVFRVATSKLGGKETKGNKREVGLLCQIGTTARPR